MHFFKSLQATAAKSRFSIFFLTFKYRRKYSKKLARNTGNLAVHFPHSFSKLDLLFISELFFKSKWINGYNIIFFFIRPYLCGNRFNSVCTRVHLRYKCSRSTYMYFASVKKSRGLFILHNRGKSRFILQTLRRSYNVPTYAVSPFWTPQGQNHNHST